MISEFVREQKRYTQKDLYKILRCSEEKAIPLIRKLKEFGVLKAVKASDLQRDMSKTNICMSLPLWVLLSLPDAF